MPAPSIWSTANHRPSPVHQLEQLGVAGTRIPQPGLQRRLIRLVDIEKASPVDFIRGGAPMGLDVVLGARVDGARRSWRSPPLRGFGFCNGLYGQIWHQVVGVALLAGERPLPMQCPSASENRITQSSKGVKARRQGSFNVRILVSADVSVALWGTGIRCSKIVQAKVTAGACRHQLRIGCIELRPRNHWPESAAATPPVQ